MQRKVMRPFAGCVAATATVTGAALMFVESSWGLPLAIGGALVLLGLALWPRGVVSR